MSEEKKARKERAAFDRRHAAEPSRITVLLGERAGGAGKAGTDVLWHPSADVLAYLDEDGELIAQAGRLEWLATSDQSGTWIHDLRPLTAYVLRVRRAAPDPAEYARYGMPVPDLSHHFALDEVLERDLRVPALDAIRERRTTTLVLPTELGELSLDRGFESFEGTITWCGAEVLAHLDVDEDAVEGAETCTVALDRLRGLVADAPAVDAAWRSAITTGLLADARSWQADFADPADPPEPISAASFTARIGLSELSLGPDGSVTAYYGDGDLFGGHVILLEVDADGELEDPYLAG